MTTKKRFSRVFAVALAIVLTMVLLAVPSFAVSPNPRAGLYYSSVSNGEYLNAYTDGYPRPGTRATTFSYTGSLTQQWRTVFLSTDKYVIEPVAYQQSSAPLVLCNQSGTAYLQPSDQVAVGEKQVKLINEGNGQIGIALVYRSPLLGLTASTQTMPAGDHSITWNGSNGLSNQLWR